MVVPLREAVPFSEIGFNRVCQKKISFASEVSFFLPNVVKYECEVQQLPFGLVSEYFAITLPKNSPLTELIK